MRASTPPRLRPSESDFASAKVTGYPRPFRPRIAGPRSCLSLRQHFQHRQPNGQHGATSDESDDDPCPHVIGIRCVIVARLSLCLVHSRVWPTQMGFTGSRCRQRLRHDCATNEPRVDAMVGQRHITDENGSSYRCHGRRGSCFLRRGFCSKCGCRIQRRQSDRGTSCHRHRAVADGSTALRAPHAIKDPCIAPEMHARFIRGPRTRS
jgi:hypothetical protein